MNIEAAKQLLRERKAAIIWKPSASGRDVCYAIVKRRGCLYVGWTQKSTQDQMNKKIARTIAIGRAIRLAKGGWMTPKKAFVLVVNKGYSNVFNCLVQQLGDKVNPLEADNAA